MGLFEADIEIGALDPPSPGGSRLAPGRGAGRLPQCQPGPAGAPPGKRPR